MRTFTYFAIAVFSIVFLSSPNSNELSNTTWRGILRMPEPYDALLKFSADTLYVIVDQTLIETSTYNVSNDTLTITKFLGNSPCSDEAGIYTFKVSNDLLYIDPISDACEARYQAFTQLGYTREN